MADWFKGDFVDFFENDFVEFWEEDFVEFWEVDFVNFWKDLPDLFDACPDVCYRGSMADYDR